MNTFVILAAGRGSRMGRMGDTLHKALVPISDAAAISHIIDVIPRDDRIIICTGWRASQIKEYVRFAYPHRENIGLIAVPRWDAPGSGPGASLLQAAPHVEGDMFFTSCDTLWDRDLSLETSDDSWMAVAPVPSGTAPERWCRVVVGSQGNVVTILDKQPRWPRVTKAYIGLGHVAQAHLPAFWGGIEASGDVGGEVQVSGGFAKLHALKLPLNVRNTSWIDIGDEEAYHRTVLQVSGYDWSKPNEATYVLPAHGKVIKFWGDKSILIKRCARGRALSALDIVPGPVECGMHMLTYPYVHGQSGYAEAEQVGHRFTTRLLDWYARTFREDRTIDITTECMMFYKDKTYQRIKMLSPELQKIALDAVARVDWRELASGARPGTFHGDFNFGNLVVTGHGKIYGIDWREDFAGLSIGDRRYDIAKLLAGTIIHWERARRGNFRLWAQGIQHQQAIKSHYLWSPEISIIAALSMLNSAPLHAAPLDEVLVARGSVLIERSVG